MAVRSLADSDREPKRDSNTPSQGWRKTGGRPRWHVLVASVGALIAVGAAAAAIYPRARGAYEWQQYEQALAGRDFARAQAHVRRYLAIWPHSGEGHFALARTCRRGGQPDTAREELHQAQLCGWHAELIELEQLLLQAQAEDGSAAISALKGLIDAHAPEEKYVLEALVIGAIVRQELPEAVSWAELWLKRSPDEWQARYWHGVALETALRDTEAVEEYTVVLAAQPDLTEVHLRLAGALRRLGRYREGLPHFEFFLRSDPNQAGALLDLARCQRGCGDSAAAAATLNRLVARQPENAHALLLRGQLALDDSRAEEAVAYLRKAQAAAPHEMETNAALGQALRALHRSEEADAFARAAEQIHGSLQRMVEIAQALMKGSHDRALRIEAGTIMRRLGQTQTAVHWFVSAHILDRSDPATNQALAECLGLSEALLDEEWLEAFTAWGRYGYFAREREFPAALAHYRQALVEAAAQGTPPFFPPADYLPQLSRRSRVLHWRQAHHNSSVDAAWAWLAEMHQRKTDRIPPVTQAEFADLARWFQSTQGSSQSLAPRLGQQQTDEPISREQLAAAIARGSRALGAGKCAASLRQLKGQRQ